ncbi:hypothetical protein [Alistipes sp.]|uniref:hypothetical protein n=1 Tax=Alistipes sp. TaxID=1872444 RepID=UPI003AEFE324
MDRNKICEAMYALPGGVVVKRRKSLAFPLLLALAGVAMIAANAVFAASLSNNVSSALVFVGGVSALAGLTLVGVRLFGSQGVPYHTQGGCYLRYDELYFGREERAEVERLLDRGAVEQLLDRPHAQVPALTVALYRTADNRFAAMQAFEYSELEYRPLTELRIVARP